MERNSFQPNSTHGGLMTLFQILTRQVATGKIKVTQKLLNRVRRETDGKRGSEPPKQPRGTHHSLGGVLGRVGGRNVAAALRRHRTGSNRRTTGWDTTGPSGCSSAALFNQANAFARDGKTGVAAPFSDSAFWPDAGLWFISTAPPPNLEIHSKRPSARRHPAAARCRRPK